MASLPTYSPGIPYVGIIDGGFHPGRMVRIQGTVLPSANRFAVNLQYGPNTSPRDDIALHVNPRFNDNNIIRNCLQNMVWGIEEKHGHMPLARGQGFEIMILCDPTHYKIAVNGQHYTEFGHRIPYQRVSYLTIDGDVTVSLIQYEGGSNVSAQGVGFVPPPMVPGSQLYPTNPVYPPFPGSVPYGAPPPQVPGGYTYQHGYGQGYPQGNYPPPPPPGYVQTSSSNKGIQGLLDKAGAMITGGVLGSKSHGHGGMGTMGTALGAGLAGAALTGHLNPKKAHKANKKAHKKALKYGLPVAGLGLGAYALHKGLHHGSSSSSSSSSEEE